MPTTRAALPYPTLTSTPDVPRDVKALADSTDAELGAPGCTSTTRPTTGNYLGRLMFETDTGRLIVWDGSTWRFVGSSATTNDTGTLITAGTGWTLDTAQLTVRYGIAHAYIAATRSGAAIGSSSDGNISNVAVAAMAAGYRPATSVGGSSGTAGVLVGMYLNNDGTIGLNALPPGVGLATGAQITASFVYPIA